MRRDTITALAFLFLVLGALAAKSLLVTLPPVRTHNAPGQFDAVRAKARLARVLGDQRPHPTDSAADDAVRARLIGELEAIGLKPIVRDQMACNDFQKARLIACARVRNVIAVLGPASGKGLLLSAHYDSVPVGPGASDDGIGVATLMEVASILKDKPLHRPIVFLFNEGEELGLVGARAFLGDPLSRGVDSVLNFDARGVTGRATMFETAGPDGAAVSAFAKAAPHPFASSLSTNVARLIPNDTDMTVYKERGWLGLNSAITRNETRYHSPGDDLAALDARSLQDMGDEALALAGELSAGAPNASGQRIFFDLLGRTLVVLPLTLGVILLGLLLLAFGGVAWKRHALFAGPGLALGAAVAGGAAAYVALLVMDLLRAGAYWRAHPEIAFTAIYATVIVGALAVLRFGPRFATKQLRAGFWLLFLLTGALLALVAPGATIYFLFPPVVVLIGIALGTRVPWAETAGSLLGLLLLYLTWGELLAALEDLFSPGPLSTVLGVAAIMIVAALIEADAWIRNAAARPLMLGSAAIALAAWGAVAAAPAYSANREQRFTIEHLTDLASRKSQWSILNDGTALPRAYGPAGPWHRAKLPFSERMRWLAPAPPIPAIKPPSIELVESTSAATDRTLRLRLHTNGAERVALILPEEAHLRSGGFAGSQRPIDGTDSAGKFTVACNGRSCDGAEVTLALSSTPQKVTIIGARNGLPPFAAPLVRARPALARPQYTPDETVTVATIRL